MNNTSRAHGPVSDRRRMNKAVEIRARIPTSSLDFSPSNSVPRVKFPYQECIAKNRRSSACSCSMRLELLRSTRGSPQMKRNLCLAWTTAEVWAAKPLITIDRTTRPARPWTSSPCDVTPNDYVLVLCCRPARKLFRAQLLDSSPKGRTARDRFRRADGDPARIRRTRPMM